MSLKPLHHNHLLWRAGFGPCIEDLAARHTPSAQSGVDELLRASAKKPQKLLVMQGTLRDFLKERQQARNSGAPDSSVRRQLRKESAAALRELNLLWLEQMAQSEQQLREKMSLFWHGHFACRSVNIFYQQELLDVVRQHALGHFGDLLRAVSKTPAMLAFLNNQQNRKQHPNENFAREVMELFTIGHGNYTEQDVKECARAYTGWGFNAQGEFVFRKNVHDTGLKRILGKTGYFNGDDALNILLEQKATARFITRKIWTFFVHEQPNEEKINHLADAFYQSNYNILELLRSIFSADWFYTAPYVGSRIKSPVEWIAGVRRMLPMQLKNPQMQLLIQRALGQILFYPPNVAGWPGGNNWIDSSTLMLRLRLPQVFAAGDGFAIETKTDDDEAMGMERNNLPKNPQVNSSIDWAAVANVYAAVSRQNLLGEITRNLLQTGAAGLVGAIEQFADARSRESYIRSVTIHTMCTPEYQLC